MAGIPTHWLVAVGLAGPFADAVASRHTQTSWPPPLPHTLLLRMALLAGHFLLYPTPPPSSVAWLADCLRVLGVLYADFCLDVPMPLSSLESAIGHRGADRVDGH